MWEKFQFDQAKKLELKLIHGRTDINTLFLPLQLQHLHHKHKFSIIFPQQYLLREFHLLLDGHRLQHRKYNLLVKSNQKLSTPRIVIAYNNLDGTTHINFLFFYCEEIFFLGVLSPVFGAIVVGQGQPLVLEFSLELGGFLYDC